MQLSLRPYRSYRGYILQNPFSNLDPRASNSFVILLILFPLIPFSRRYSRRLQSRGGGGGGCSLALSANVTRRITYVSGVK